MQDDDDNDNIVPFPERPGNFWREAGQALTERRQAGDDFRTALKAVFGWDHELDAAIEATWPRGSRDERAFGELAGIIMCYVEMNPEERPKPREFFMQEIAATAENHKEWAEQELIERASGRHG